MPQSIHASSPLQRETVTLIQAAHVEDVRATLISLYNSSLDNAEQIRTHLHHMSLVRARIQQSKRLPYDTVVAENGAANHQEDVATPVETLKEKKTAAGNGAAAETEEKKGKKRKAPSYIANCADCKVIFDLVEKGEEEGCVYHPGEAVPF